MAKKKKTVNAVAKGIPLNDGGSVALIGFLYQLLGTAAIFISLPNLDPKGDAIWHIEVRGQDAMAGHRLYQFKFSADQTPIPPSELKVILKALQSACNIINAPIKNIKCCLVTNRPLSPDADRLWAGKKLAARRRTSNATQLLISKFRNNLEITITTLDKVKSDLKKRAALFGISDPSPGITAVVGTLMQKAASAPAARGVTKQELERLLTDIAQPRSLLSTDLKEPLRAELMKLAKQIGPPLDDVISRPEITKLLQNKDMQLAVIYGGGGTGKTVSVVRGLYDLLDHEQCAIAVIIPYLGDQNSDLATMVQRWRGNAPCSCSVIDAILMLRTANPTIGRRFLVIALDALDEEAGVVDRERLVATLVRTLFPPGGLRDATEVSVIVTSRDREQLSRHLRGDGPEAATWQIGYCKLGPFDDVEFVNVWTKWFPNVQPPALQSDAPAGGIRLGSSNVLGAAKPTYQLSAELSHAIRHPVILGCIKAIQDVDLVKICQGDGAEWRRVWIDYVGWFTRKVYRIRSLPHDEARAIIVAAAKATANETYTLEHDWIIPANKATGMAPLLCKHVFRDAGSSGLIDCPDNTGESIRREEKWYWQIPAVADYLRTLA